jgi:ubiquinone/menaquinone biosynthesis C-methylase UbiE
MTKEFWNERYAESDFAYGKEPNALLKKILEKIPAGKILFPAEGEGRNAVYAATLGWDAFAFDISEEGKRKTEQLADEKGVNVHYTISDFQSFGIEENAFDCIALVFTHLPQEIRKTCYQRLLKFLKPGGELIAIGFSKQQLGKTSGGPKDINMLFSREQLLDDFAALTKIEIHEEETTLDEGPFHQGNASVIWMVGKR